MEPRCLMTACFILAFGLVTASFFLAARGRFKTGLTAITLALVAATGTIFVDAADDTPTWRDRIEAKYGVEVGKVHENALDQPGAWQIDGEWRSCYSPDFDFTAEDLTLLCQPVAPETEYPELAR